MLLEALLTHLTNAETGQFCLLKEMTTDGQASTNGSPRTTEREVFARNLTGIVQRSRLSRRQFAERHGLDYKTLCRWLTKGVTNPDKRTREKLVTLCQSLGERFDDLWKEHVSTADIGAAKNA